MKTFFNPSSRWYYPSRWLVLILLGLGIYARTFWFGFVFDDQGFIVNNPYIKRFDLIQHIWNIFPKTRALGFYSFAFNYFINQLHPQGYHILNFVIHLLATGFVWAIATVLFKITGEKVKKKKPAEWAHSELPYLIAVIFLVHPCQTQAVTYISQRFESMATVFYLGSIYSYLRGRMASSREHKILLFIFSAGFSVLGIFTKEIAVTIPFMIFAIEYILLSRTPYNSKKDPSWRYYLPVTILGFIFAVLFIKIVRTDFFDIYFHFSAPSESHDGDIITGGKYVLTQMRVFLTFLRLLILPINQNVDYDYPLSTGFLGPPLTLVGLCLISYIAFLIFKLRKQWPLIAFGLAWVLITFSINTAPRVNVIFEHKLYLISFGFILATVCGLSVIIKDRKVLSGFWVTIIVVLSLVSYTRNQVWENELTLWSDAVQKSPHKARPYNSRGLAYFYQGNLSQAISDFNKAIEIKPGYSKAYVNRGLVYYNQGILDQAMSDYNKAIEINPENAEAFNNRGIVYYNEGNTPKAMSDYNRAIEINPDYGEAYFNRGNIFDDEGDINRALFDFNRAIEINPSVAGVYYNRGLLFAKQGDLPQAIADFTKTIEMNPENAEVYVNRGIIFARQSDFTRAISDYNKAIEINPNDAGAYNRCGICYFQQGNFSQAMLDYNQAIAINPNNAQVYYDRAAIYYQLKEYDKVAEDIHKVESLGIKVNPIQVNRRFQTGDFEMPQS